MPRTARKYAATFAVYGCLLFSSGEAANEQQPPTPRVRSLAYHSPQRIADRLLPDDEIVELVDQGDVAVFERQPTPQEMLRIAIGDALDVAIVDVGSAKAELVDDGRAIATFLTGSVREVLKRSPTSSLRDRELVTIVLGGGEVRIGKTVVRTKGDLRQLPPLGEYVMFMSNPGVAPAGRDLSFAPMLLREGTVSPVTVDANAALLRGVSLGSIKEEARRQSRGAKK